MAKWYCPESKYSQISEKDYGVRRAIELVLEKYTRDMENYSYYGSNLGVSENDYDDVAEDIMSVLKLWEEDNE